MSSNAFSQQPVFQWAKHFGNPSFSGSNGNSGAGPVAVDGQGNVYSAGFFYGTIDFDPGPGIYNLSTPFSYEANIFISKLGPAGDFIWAIQFPLVGVVTMTTDQQGNIYLASELQRSADMDPGPGVYNISPIGAKDAFVVKITTDGKFVWVKQFGGPGDTVPASTALDLDKEGNVIICGTFNNKVDFDPGPDKFEMSAVGTFEAFITKLTSDGDLIWARKLGNFNTKYEGLGIEDAKCDAQGNLYLTGAFKGNCDFDPGPNNFTFQSGGPADGYLCKLDKEGNFVFAKKFGNSIGNNVVTPRGIVLDGQNNVLIVGSFLGIQDFDPGPTVANVTSNGAFDAFILKLTAQGDFTWVKNTGGQDVDQGIDITVDQENNVYTIGLYYGSVDFDPTPGVFALTMSDGTVLTKLDPDGNFVYAAPFYGYSLGRSIVVDAAQNIYIAGALAGSVDFDPGPAVFTLTGGPNRNEIFVLKLGRCLNQTRYTMAINSCSSYLLNNKVYEASGSYTQVIPNAVGCDSIITLHLTINKKLSRQTKTICEGESFFAGGANQTIAGIYTDTLQTTLGCDSVVVTTLTIHPKPTPDLGLDKNLCADSSLTLTPGVFTNYLWQDHSTGNAFTANAVGQYWVTVTNSYQCSATDTLTIHSMLPRPGGFLKSADSICSYETVLLRPAGSFRSYLWSTGATSTTLEVSAPGAYWLKISDANGCSGIDTIVVLSKQCLQGTYIPTAFSPNGDGKNDLFRPLFFGRIKQFRFMVYNRWGEVVFQTTELQKGWDGRIAGVPLETGVFVWTCTYQKEGEPVKNEKGTVTLVR